MITLEQQKLVIRFPDIHKDAMARITFQRTLRIPDDGSDYPLPPGMGEFPLHHIDDYRSKLPAGWARHGGVFMPMYQSEALWLNFDGGYHDYPIAIQGNNPGLTGSVSRKAGFASLLPPHWGMGLPLKNNCLEKRNSEESRSRPGL